MQESPNHRRHVALCGIACMSTLAAAGPCDATALFGTGVQFGTAAAPNNVALWDLNGDGSLDVVVATLATVSVLLGDGSGSLSASQSFNNGGATTSIGLAIGDLNQDGVPDIASTNIVFPFVPIVSVILGNGDGTFGMPQVYQTNEFGGFPFSVAIADITGNGVPDLAVANDDGSISVLSGIGNGSFQNAVVYSAGQSPNSIVAGDFDDDGRVDLAITDYGTGTVGILLASIFGGFQPMESYPTGDGAREVSAEDLDGDGVLDLVVVNELANTVSVLKGFPGGVFLPFGDYETGENPVSAAIGDLDGDGLPDLAVANLDSNTVSFYRGFGDCTFSQKIDFTTSDRPSSVVAGDLNSDGLLDLVVSVGNTGVEVLFNQCGTLGPCSPADLAEPFGELSFFDVTAFIAAFNSQEPAADFNDDGIWNFFDVNEFLNTFNAGCP